MNPQNRRRLRPAGGYRSLRSFQTATLIYDATVRFCDRWIEPRSRTRDQMVQAARSGRQNIAEGSRASATSSKSEVHLTNVARASLEELLLDLEDFLRQRKLPQWESKAESALQVRKLSRRIVAIDREISGKSHRAQDDARAAIYAQWLESDDPTLVANALICLIHQTNYLLDQNIAVLEKEIIETGGYRERLTAARVARRSEALGAPACPQCGRAMRERVTRHGPRRGARFWGCPLTPHARGRER